MKASYNDGSEFSDEFDTVIFAIGRDAETAKLGLEKVRGPFYKQKRMYCRTVQGCPAMERLSYFSVITVISIYVRGRKWWYWGGGA